MALQPDNLVVELLRAIRADIAELRIEQREHRDRIGAVERTTAHIQVEQAEMAAEMSGRFDRGFDRLDRIDRRLELRNS